MSKNPDLLAMKGVLYDLPEAERKQVEELTQKLRDLVKESEAIYPASGILAFGLVALELHEGLDI